MRLISVKANTKELEAQAWVVDMVMNGGKKKRFPYCLLLVLLVMLRNHPRVTSPRPINSGP